MGEHHLANIINKCGHYSTLRSTQKTPMIYFPFLSNVVAVFPRSPGNRETLSWEQRDNGSGGSGYSGRTPFTPSSHTPIHPSVHGGVLRGSRCLNDGRRLPSTLPILGVGCRSYWATSAAGLEGHDTCVPYRTQNLSTTGSVYKSRCSLASSACVAWADQPCYGWRG
jgi:hypothetical protein